MDRRTMMKGATATAAVAGIGGTALLTGMHPGGGTGRAPLQKAMLAAAEFHGTCFKRGCRLRPINSFSIRSAEGMDPTDVFSRSGHYVNVSMDVPWSSEPLNAIFTEAVMPGGGMLVVARRIDRPTGITHDDFHEVESDAGVMKFARFLAQRLFAEHKAESLAA